MLLLSLSWCRDKDCRDGGCRVSGRTLRTLSFVNSSEVASGEVLLMTIASDDLASDDVSSGALLQTRFFRCISSDASKLQIKFFCSWTCSIRIFMNSTLIMDPVHLNKLFSISNWWFLIPCYYQNLRGDFEKHPLFQHIVGWGVHCAWSLSNSYYPGWAFSWWNDRSCLASAGTFEGLYFSLEVVAGQVANKTKLVKAWYYSTLGQSLCGEVWEHRIISSFVHSLWYFWCFMAAY